MNKYASLLLASLFSLSAFAQDPSTTSGNEQGGEDQIYLKNNIIMVQPLSFFVGGIRMGYELFVKDQHALKLSAGYYYTEGSNIYDTYDGYEGFNAMFQYKKYLLPRKGRDTHVYVSAYALYKEITLRPQGNNFTQEQYAAGVSPGVMIGFNYVFPKVPLTVDFGLGGGFMFPTSSGNGSDEAHLDLVNAYRRGIAGQMELAIGYTF